MMRKILTAGMTAALLATPVTSSQVLEVVITGNGFFPTVTYLKPGDTVRFYNAATFDVRVIAQDNDTETSDWRTEDIQPHQYESVLVLEESLLTFEMHGKRWVPNTAQGEGEATDREGSELSPEDGSWEDVTSLGEFTFDPVKLQ